MSDFILNASVTEIKGVGEKVALKLRQLEIETIEDVCFNIPRAYNDYSNVDKISDIVPGEVTIKGRIGDITSRYVRRGMHITQASVDDGSGKVAVVWFNQPFRSKSINANEEYYVSGNYDFKARKYVLSNPACELVDSDNKTTARIVPVYKETKGVKSSQLRNIVFATRNSLKLVKDSLPLSVLGEHELMPLADALWAVHFPESTQQLEEARYRLGFDEVFELSLAAQLNKRDIAKFKAPPIPFKASVAKELVESLSFSLTAAQKRAAWSILGDIGKDLPMNRLLEGDVGSGKTVVAALAVVMAKTAGCQVAIMAPTAILASQHLDTFRQLLGDRVRVEMLVSSIKAADKKQLKEEVALGNVDVVVGTHALIQSDVNFNNLGLVVIDEQHRFGVKQRQKLVAHSVDLPHMLSMTATPIPRTLALTLYGEMDISVIDELPPGRLPVITEIHSPNSTKPLYKHIDDLITDGQQAFIICPLIEDSDTLGLKSVESEFKRLKSTVLKKHKITMLHGRMSQDEKDDIMSDFHEGKIDILLSTTVVEVGVNVPNATIMLIEGAERFGLAQLHQLRGRVGRANKQAYCYLVPSTSKKPSQRLRQMELTTDGFKLAEVDLEMRGPGEIYGKRQHGSLDLRIARLTDVALISKAQQAAQEFIASGNDLLQYPRLDRRVRRLRAVTKLQ